MLTLEVVNLHWVDGAVDDPFDLCAHGTVRLRVGEHQLPALEALDCTVSAAAIYLLRTLARPHHRGGDEDLFPCCGFAMFEVPGNEDVMIQGCPDGVDLDVMPEGAHVALGMPDGSVHLVDADAWREAVLAFADRVADFYRRSSPKRPPADEAAGFSRLQREWERRRGAPLCGR